MDLSYGTRQRMRRRRRIRTRRRRRSDRTPVKAMDGGGCMDGEVPSCTQCGSSIPGTKGARRYWVLAAELETANCPQSHANYAFNHWEIE